MVVNPDVGAGNPDPLQEHPDLLHVWMFCLHVCMCPMHTTGQKKVLDLLELESGMVISHYVGAGR